ncbi:NACHT, LRR and PYD domains-containing protein 3-like isoform X2 [Alosa pseudoharengus]|uniref:NACHT, LRR and PYD domains-containing protein 3-like isoform X2 n=1 Tax=Alosa pseudoharengus TaxID=34774 RepID=UPI003F8B26C2
MEPKTIAKEQYLLNRQCFTIFARCHRVAYSQIARLVLRVQGAASYASLRKCSLSSSHCKDLASILSSSANNLKELDLRDNDLQDSGVELLSSGLQSLQCTLEILKLSASKLTVASWRCLTSVYHWELDLSESRLLMSELEHLSAALRSPDCRVNTLRLKQCFLKDDHCGVLASVLSSDGSHLKELDLSDNDLQDSGVEMLSSALQNSQCTLKILRLSLCGVTQKGCEFLASALRANPSYLRELDLSCNHPGEAGVKLLSERKNDPDCKLDTLIVDHDAKGWLNSRLDKTISFYPGEETPRGHPARLVATLAQPSFPQSDSTSGDNMNTQKDNAILWRVMYNHNASLKSRFENTPEGVIKPGAEIRLNKTYTELYITEGESEGVNKEHELWQVESASRSQTIKDTPINCNNIFKPLPGRKKHIRTVMTKGVAGIGKTVSVQQFIFDWLDGVANKSVDFIFPLSFRELNLIRGDQYSFQRLLLYFHPELKMLNGGDEYKDCRVVFIFDGLDESQISLNFQSKNLVSDINQTSSVDVLVTSLIQGTLLSSALIWITSRPASASQIPAQYIDQVTEVRGFSDPQKEEYFRKRISNESHTSIITSHIKACRSLHVLCRIPAFSCIAATVLQQMLEQENTQEFPKTLTEMFMCLLIVQTSKGNGEYQQHNRIENKEILRSQKEIILKLAELAFKNLNKSNTVFYEEDLRECGIDVGEASMYSGICTEIFKEESMLHQKKVYCFVYLSIQEFLAALHVFVSYNNQMETIKPFFSLEESLKFTIANVLESRNGHLDLFLRFLMGLSSEKNQRLLKGLLKNTHSTSKSIKEMCQYIKDLDREDLSPERCINLSNCLLEMNDHSIHEEIQRFQKSPNGFRDKLSHAHCSALAHILLMSEEVLDELDLNKYNTSDEGRRRLIPAVSCCRKAQLLGCGLNKMSCETVMRCLQSANSLIQLDMSCNALGDSGVHLLSAGLISPHCKLQTLRLGDCNLSGESCKPLATVLQSANSLIELDLSHNDLGDSGVNLLSKGLSHRNCNLQILRLSGCLISESSCYDLASSLTSNTSHLKELDLSYNHPGESGLTLLSATLEDPRCKLEILNTDHSAEIRLRPGVRKYACELVLDPNTASRRLTVSDQNRTLRGVSENYPDHPDRFHYWPQVLCREGLSGRCYWEAEWSEGVVHVAVAYKSIKRKGKNDDSRLGCNAKSWSLRCSPDSYSARHNNERTDIPAPSSGSRRVGVYLDWPAGTLCFYSVSSDTLTHLHTFYSTFTEPLYAGFMVYYDSSASLCQIT